MKGCVRANKKRLAGPADGFKDRQQLRDRADVHVAQQNARLLEHDAMAVGIGEQRRQVAAVDQQAVH
ncbi:hypothetical protein WJ33_34765 [Burkholderia ubonensis]|uniref:Uncharacterized protein n=1 Tax=Burkholderia ubonensis TaxID=101571 RepID=A0A103QXW5_9BURK|nr:hypothetical protein WJ33_34765 [Burkholderia ubonensis]